MLPTNVLSASCCTNSQCNSSGTVVDGVMYCCPEGGYFSFVDNTCTCSQPQSCSSVLAIPDICYTDRSTRTIYNGNCAIGRKIRVTQAVIEVKDGPVIVRVTSLNGSYSSMFRIADRQSALDFSSIINDKLFSDSTSMKLDIECDRSITKCSVCYATITAVCDAVEVVDAFVKS